MGPDYNFSKRPPNTTGVPDFTCHYLVESLILVSKLRGSMFLRMTFPEFYQADEKARTRSNKSTTELWISKTLPLQSVSHYCILKAYAYYIITRQAKDNPESSHPQVLVVMEKIVFQLLNKSTGFQHIGISTIVF